MHDLSQFKDDMQTMGILQEECAEVIQSISKIRRFGMNSYHPDDATREPEYRKLAKEVGELFAMVYILTERGFLDEHLIQAGIDDKFMKLDEFYDFGDLKIDTK